MANLATFVVLAYEMDGTVHVIGTTKCGNPMRQEPAERLAARLSDYYDSAEVMLIETVDD